MRISLISGCVALILLPVQVLSFERPLFEEYSRPGERFAFQDAKAVQQGAENYICTFKQGRYPSWISDKIAFSLNGTGSATVTNGVLAKFDRAPKSASASRGAGKNLSVRWTVRNARDKDNRHAAILSYELKLNRQTGVARVYMRPGGNYRNAFNGKGQCDLR